MARCHGEMANSPELGVHGSLPRRETHTDLGGRPRITKHGPWRAARKPPHAGQAQQRGREKHWGT